MVSVTAIIQARMGSTRFPGKSLHLIASIPLLEHIIIRLQRVPEIDSIILAIPDNETNTPLLEFAHQLQVPVFQGSEEDVLGRFIKAGESVPTEHIIRVCGDNPLIDIPLLRSLISAHLQSKADYTIPLEPVPLGSSCEIIRLKTLKRISTLTENSIYREHVTTWFHDHPTSFCIEYVNAPYYLRDQNFRLTVDTDQDFQLMEALFKNLPHSSSSPLNLEAVINYLINHPETAALNIDIAQNNWREKNI
jgi:spore coat polysaccharide biosynthesis protein SpsF